jgi:hypothetical protein
MDAMLVQSQFRAQYVMSRDAGLGKKNGKNNAVMGVSLKPSQEKSPEDNHRVPTTAASAHGG